jgi:hypothetical protein
MIDGKANIYLTYTEDEYPEGYKERDLWIDWEGTLWYCISDQEVPGTFNADDWETVKSDIEGFAELVT